MQSEGFRAWRKALGLSQKDAAEALGLKRRMVQYYEKGERDGETVEIPLSVRLACFALTRGVIDYAGPPHGPKRDDKLRRRTKRLRDREKGKATGAEPEDRGASADTDETLRPGAPLPLPSSPARSTTAAGGSAPDTAAARDPDPGNEVSPTAP